jgi:hypothetical protein
VGLVRITVCERKESGVEAVWGYVLWDRGRRSVKVTWSMDVTQFVGGLWELSGFKMALFGHESELRDRWLGAEVTELLLHPLGFQGRQDLGIRESMVGGVRGQDSGWNGEGRFGH